MKTAVFTIVSNNYLAYARTLMASAAAIHPEWERHVLLVDLPVPSHPEHSDLFTTTLVHELNLPNAQQFFFRYSVMELNTAVKPWIFSRLLNAGYDRVVYLDPDIWIIDRLEALETLFSSGSTGVLTPHLCAPIDDTARPSESDIMRCGAYNLGFLALRQDAETHRFLAWWQRKLEYGAAVDFEAGLFTDQKWIDLAPGMFAGFSILRDPGYNVAYWNLMHREIKNRNEKWYSNDVLLRFFHFSGLDPRNPAPLSKHQDRFKLENIGEASVLVRAYCKALLSAGHEELRLAAYGFARFNDGRAIPDCMRRGYRRDHGLQHLAGENPFAYPNAFDTIIDKKTNGIVLDQLWRDRQDLQRAFPSPLGASRIEYLRWAVTGGAAEAGVDAAWIEQVAPYLQSTVSGIDEPQGATPNRDTWADRLVRLHWRARGRGPDPESQALYERVHTPAEFVRRAFGMITGYRRRHGWRATARAIGKALLRPASGGVSPLTKLRVGGSITPPPRAEHHVSSRTRLLGIYPADNEPSWASPVLSFNVSGSAVVEIEGIHPAELLQKANGTSEQILVARTRDGKEISRLQIADSGPFSWSFSVSPSLVTTLKGSFREGIEISAESCFSPKKIGLNEDSRLLAFQLIRITCDGRDVYPIPTPPIEDASSLPIVDGINLIGYVRSEMGLGQSARAFADAISAADIQFCALDFNLHNSTRCEDNSLGGKLRDDPVYSVNVIHVNADQIPTFWAHRRCWTHGRCNIGFWHWELPELPDEYLIAFEVLDEVWVPSAFMQSAIADKSPIPVVKMPHAVTMKHIAPIDRADLDLPRDKFLFLVMYDFSSYQARKNPQAALAAFDAAFTGGDKLAGLVIKTQNSAAHPAARAALSEWLEGRKNCYWIDQTLSREHTNALLKLCDCYVSLHRSEGFGFGPAEAMYLGKSVIATGWSGNMEFMTAANSFPVDYRLIEIEQDVGVYRKGNIWADPCIEDAACSMRKLVDDDALRARIGSRAAEYMRQFHSPEVVGVRIREQLRQIALRHL